MRGGVTIAAIAITAGAAWAWARVNRDFDQAFAWGDIPRLPEGLAATREIDSAGRSVLHGQRPLGFARHIAHDSEATSR